MDRRQVKKKKRRQKTKKRVLLGALFLGLALAIYSGYIFYEAYQAASKTYDDLDREKSDLREEQVAIEEEPFSVLIMGVEDYSSDGGVARADTIMLATFNPDDDHVKLVSIPRDSRVSIPGYSGKEKINHAFAYGEEKLQIETVEELMDVPVDYYATVDFEGFKNIVDIVGGVTVDVPFDFQQNSDDRVAEKLQFYEGKMTLDGRYALAYARMRLEDPRGDIGRNERQQQVIKALTSELMSGSTLLKVDDIAQSVGDNVKTNVKVSQGINFLRKNTDFGKSNIETLSFDYRNEYINNTAYVILNEESVEEISHVLKVHLGLEEPVTTQDSDDEQQDESSQY